MNENITESPAAQNKRSVEQLQRIMQDPGIDRMRRIKQEPGINQEQTEYDRVSVTKRSKEILMEVSTSRKKVVYLNGSNSLLTEFNKLISSDPSLSHVLSRGYPVFQVFNPKFKTLVDIDREENLEDGAIVKVIFYNKEIGFFPSHPQSMKRKREDFESEPNFKQPRMDNNRIDSGFYSHNWCIERNDTENVDPQRKMNVWSPGARKCLTERRPRYRNYRNLSTESVRKNLFPNFRSNSVDRWGSEGKSTPREMAPFPMKENKQCFLVPEEDNSNTRDSLSNAQPLHVEENLQANSSQNTCPENVTPAKVLTLVFESKHPANSPQNTTERKASEVSISWEMRPKQLSWMQQIMGKIWWNTIFSDVAAFGLEGNYIKYFEEINPSRKDVEIFWGSRSLAGPSIIAPLGFSVCVFKLHKVLKHKFVRIVNDHYKDCEVTLQFLDSWKSQFNSYGVRDLLMKNSVELSEWPCGAKDLSPITHAWKLVGEKVKNIPCTTKEQMISVVSEVWDKDSDVQVMCSKVIKLLPEIIKFVVEQGFQVPHSVAT